MGILKKMSKTRAERNKEKIQKIKDTGAKQVAILLSKEEFETLQDFMKLHKIASYREFVNFSTSYKLTQFNDVYQIPIDEKHPDSFIRNGKKYVLNETIVYAPMCRDLDTGEIFPTP